MSAIMKYFVALIAGAMSGLLIYMVSAMLFLTDTADPPSWFIPVTFLGGWALSTFVSCARRTRCLQGSITGISSRAPQNGSQLSLRDSFSPANRRQRATTELSSDAEVAGTVIGAGPGYFLDRRRRLCNGVRVLARILHHFPDDPRDEKRQVKLTFSLGTRHAKTSRQPTPRATEGC